MLKTLIARLSRSHLVVGIVLGIAMLPVTYLAVSTLIQMWIINVGHTGQIILNLYVTAFAAMTLFTLWSMALIDIKIGLQQIRQ